MQEIVKEKNYKALPEKTKICSLVLDKKFIIKMAKLWGIDEPEKVVCATEVDMDSSCPVYVF